ncbi:unnamed protein product [Brassica rapa]|nr:unnamed protein product [Brassica rapa]
MPYFPEFKKIDSQTKKRSILFDLNQPYVSFPKFASGKKKREVRLSMEPKQGNVSAMGVGVSAAATAALTAVMSNLTMAFVDERLSTKDLCLRWPPRPFILLDLMAQGVK